MKRDELRELMKSIAYPEGWFYVERAAVIMFGLSATLAPKLNGIHVGFPYITQFIIERNAKRLAEAAAAAKLEASHPALPVAPPASENTRSESTSELKPDSKSEKKPESKSEKKEEALLN